MAEEKTNKNAKVIEVKQFSNSNTGAFTRISKPN